MTQFKNITGVTLDTTLAVGSSDRRPWDVLLEIDIQNVSIRGTITAHANNQEAAEKLAKIEFVNNLRRAGIWESISQKIDENEKTIPVYYAPALNHVKVIEVVNNGQYDLTYSEDELTTAAQVKETLKRSAKPKKRTSGQKALADRQKKKESKQQKTMSKKEVLKTICEYFEGADLRQIKDAAANLGLQYQKVRHSLFLIKNKGFDGNSFELLEGTVDGKKAFRLKEKKE